VDAASQVVTGTVRVKLFKGRAAAVGATSPRSLYDPALASFAMKDFDVTAARGFIDLFGLPMKVGGMRQARTIEKRKEKREKKERRRRD
jgi:argininosuccinate synthase